jgi:hypothetical protein
MVETMRTRSRRRRVARLLAAVLVSLFSLALAEDAFFHTDDGCAVELHCLSCRWHQGATAVSAPVTVPLGVLQPGAVVDRADGTVRLEGARPETPSRAPPLA